MKPCERAGKRPSLVESRTGSHDNHVVSWALHQWYHRYRDPERSPLFSRLWLDERISIAISDLNANSK